MKKGLLVVLTLLVFASIASANRTRVATMGWNDVLLWDEENIFWCPALAMGYPNEIIGELGSFDPPYVQPGSYFPDAYLGTFLTNDEMASMGVLGLVVNRSTAATPSGFPDDPIPAFDLIYARSLNGFGIGGMLSLERNSASFDAGDTLGTEDSTFSVMALGFTPGVTFTLGEKGSVDLGFRFQLNSFSSEIEENYGSRDKWTTEGDGAKAMDADLRATLPMGEYVFVIPYFGFGMSNLNYKMTSTTPDTSVGYTSDKRTSFGGGIGLNVMPFEETTVLAGFGLAMWNEENSSPSFPDSIDKMSAMTPALTVGAESRFNSWMTGRIGATKTFFASRTDEDYHGNKTSWASDSFRMALGIGLNIGDFNLDAMLHENFLFQGPNFIGGYEDPPHIMLSAEYNFSGM